MKKLLALLLAAVMCLSLAACGGSGETPGTDNNSGTQDSTETLIPATNNGEIETIAPPGVPGENTQYITVEITSDNWFEYFELVEEIVYHTDDFGDFSSVNNFWRLELKEGYSSKHSLSIHFEVQYNLQKVSVEINHDTKEVIKIDGDYEVLTKTDKVETSGDMALIAQTFIQDFELQDPSQQYIYYISDFQVLRVAGDTTIELGIITE
ncbi:MAG: hypothetical protein IKK00_05115 [Oscillospiraceae bacterium]|nr:hypothetical protein [Oscillospiraceae bacterium]